MYKLNGYARFENGRTVTDEDVYRYVGRHSRVIDRINPRKLVEMTFWAFDILSGSVTPPFKTDSWKFYDKNPETKRG